MELKWIIIIIIIIIIIMNSPFGHMQKILKSRKKGLQYEPTPRRSVLVDEMIVTQT